MKRKRRSESSDRRQVWRDKVKDKTDRSRDKSEREGKGGAQSPQVNEESNFKTLNLHELDSSPLSLSLLNAPG